MKKIKNITILIMMSVVLMCSSCTEIINTEADEIRSFEWQIRNDDISAALSFENDNAALAISSYGESCIIKGLCIISENTIVIIDNSLKNEYVFNYSLSGQSLILERNGETAAFYKSGNREQH